MTLAQKIAAEIASAKAIQTAAKAQNRDITDDEAKAIDAHLATVETLKVDAKAEEEAATKRAATLSRLEDEDAALAAVPAPKSGAGASAPVARAPATAREGFLADPKRGFKSLGEQALAIHAHGTAHPTMATDKRLVSLAAATGMNQNVGAEGGFAVAPGFSKEIWDGLNGDDGAVPLLAMTDLYDITGQESLTIPANAETSRATGSRYGGARGYWLAEAGQLTGGVPKLRNVKSEAHELAVLVYATDKLMKNAPALGAYLSRASRSEINFMTSDAIINGTGTGQPKGLLTSGSIVSVAKETSQTAATVVTENLVKMMARMHPNSRKRAIWVANVDVEPQLMLASISIRNVAGSDNVGGSAVPAYNPAAGTLLGRPIYFIEACATLGTVGDILFWDPKSYLATVQGGVEEAMSIHLRFDYKETAFRFSFAVDGQPYLASALTPFKGSNTLSTHVSLATRS